MALVSILSLKLTNPSLPVRLLCDSESARWLQESGHRLPGLCDSVVVVEAPEGSLIYRHRWMKTQLPRFLPGDGIHLDADILVRSSLAALPHGDWDFAAVPDYNSSDMSELLRTLPHVIQALELGWPLDLTRYFNSGVFCWKDTPAVHAFFAEWHRLWQEGVEAGELLKDQPSFNTTLQRGLVTSATLPNAFNTMVLPAWELSPEAVVWHFWSAGSSKEHSFAQLVEQAKHLSTEQLTANVRRAIRFSRPWPNSGRALARLLDWRGHRFGGYRTVERLWLYGQRRATVLHLLKRVRGTGRGSGAPR
ncbi:putative nucleotide-diphospho-sugar transferase [Synechococcus sp. CCAP 1479/10]|nr:putative nucleotide-diphospho-sugar transferase [Synechococcus sp. CCAP 1479/10]